MGHEIQNGYIPFVYAIKMVLVEELGITMVL